MALGLTLTAALVPENRRYAPADARDWLSRAAVWFEAVGDAVLDAHLDRDSEGRPHLRIICHPAADAIDVKISSAGRLKLIARTSPAGPGYHAYLVTLLRQFAVDFEFAWEPPPGDHDPGCFFVNGDHARLETLFHHWLAARCQQALTRVKEPYSVGLPRGVRYLHPGPVLTPTGPRSLDWLKRVAAEETAGDDFFAWWTPKLDAEFYKGRALARLWMDFPHRPPLTEFEGEMIDQIAADLANALDSDVMLELPWGAWLDVISAIEADGGKHCVEPIAPELKLLIVEKSAGRRDDSGYRRHPVRVPLTGDWLIDVPGHFATKWNDDGLTWTAWDSRRTVWFRGLSVEGQSASEALDVGRGNLPPGEPVTARMHRDVLGEAVVSPHEEEGEMIHRLSGIAAADGQLAACKEVPRESPFLDSCSCAGYNVSGSR